MQQSELVIRIAQAEKELAAAVNLIMEKHALPCFLTELIFDRIHHQLINGKNSELAAAMESSAAKASMLTGDRGETS